MDNHACGMYKLLTGSILNTLDLYMKYYFTWWPIFICIFYELLLDILNHIFKKIKLSSHRDVFADEGIGLTTV